MESLNPKSNKFVATKAKLLEMMELKLKELKEIEKESDL